MRNKILPYMTNEEIIELVSYIDRNTTMLEIGGGNSTIFLSNIVKKLTTIEHNFEWSKTIKDLMKDTSFDWEIHVIEPNWPQSHPFQPAENGQFNNYVNFIESLSDNEYDVVLVDGRDRVRCSIASIPKLKDGGILLIHDFWNRPKYHSLLKNFNLQLIEDTNSFFKNENCTLVAFKKIN